MHVGKHVILAAVHQRGQLGYTGSQLVGDLAPLRLGILGVFLREGGGDEGGDDAASTLAGMGQRIAGEVDAAALPGRTEGARDRCLDALVAVGDDQFHPA